MAQSMQAGCTARANTAERPRATSCRYRRPGGSPGRRRATHRPVTKAPPRSPSSPDAGEVGPPRGSRTLARLCRAKQSVLGVVGEDVQPQALGNLLAHLDAPDTVAVHVEPGREDADTPLPGTTARMPPLTPLLAGMPI